ncbi:Hypothetical protein A7982_09330 [Minicystis rosea]|nr:Hypothetical protein A7982_09330 [Minicystis rosea]
MTVSRSIVEARSTRRSSPRLAAAATLIAALAFAPTVRATPPAELTVDAFPIFGSGATIAQGWSEVTVRIGNNTPKPMRGQVDVSMKGFMRGVAGRSFLASAPFSVGGGASIHVRVPAHVGLYGDLLVEVRNEEGAIVHATRFPTFTPRGITLLDVTEVSALRGVLHDAVITPLAYTGGSHGTAPTLDIAIPRFDPATGDPLLPDRAALYTSADAVLLRSDILSRLSGADLEALAGYALAGGTIAVAIARPEDLRHPTLVAFAGGPITRQGVSAETLKEFSLPAPVATLPPSAKQITATREPAKDVIEQLGGFTGGNLHGSLYGASATYGLGEVHLLAFDPTRKPAVDDPWAQARVLDLARRAYDRRTTQVFRPGHEPGTPSYSHVRQQLDPNESSRWAIGAAAILLCIYAIVAGPINFGLAGKAGRPLRALRWLPIISAIALALVVVVGVIAKGVHGRSRHLTLVEAGAGMTKGSARRFRGFYASRARELTVRTTDGTSLVSTAVLPEYADQKDHIIVDREGARLVEVAALPWQTVVVREDGFVSLGDGIALVKDGETGVAVINRSGHDLRAALLRSLDGKPYYFARIKDGDRVVTAAAQTAGASPGGKIWETAMLSPYRTGSINAHRLSAHLLRPLIETDAPGLAEAWSALEEAAAEGVDWFPDHVPTLVAQLDGGEGHLGDAGLRLESDRLLVRVVGLGGRP